MKREELQFVQFLRSIRIPFSVNYEKRLGVVKIPFSVNIGDKKYTVEEIKGVNKKILKFFGQEYSYLPKSKWVSLKQLKK